MRLVTQAARHASRRKCGGARSSRGGGRQRFAHVLFHHDAVQHQPLGEQIALPSDLITLSKSTRSAIHSSFGTFSAAAGRLLKRAMSEH